MTTTIGLLVAIGDHLAAFELPTIASVHVAASISAPQVTVQLACHEPSAIASNLLAWADTLAEVTAEARRIPQGDSVHLLVTGLLPGGASILVYGGLPASTGGLCAELAPDSTTTIPLAALRHAAAVDEVSA